MATYEDLRKANETIETTNIKGKEYAEVNQRIKAFRMVYPEGYICTELVSNENGVCIFYASVGYTTETGDQIPLGEGHAYEKEGSSFINKRYYIENCETSAVGRALGMAGFGIDTSVASYEEVGNAIANQEERVTDGSKPVTDREVATLKKMAEKYKQNISDICRTYKINRLEDMNHEMYGKALMVFKELEKGAAQ